MSPRLIPSVTACVIAAIAPDADAWYSHLVRVRTEAIMIMFYLEGFFVIEIIEQCLFNLTRFNIIFRNDFLLVTVNVAPPGAEVH